MSDRRVLVLCATGKVGRNACLALKEAGYEVYGTSRSEKNELTKIGVTPIVCDYTKRPDLDRALAKTGAKKVFAITDYFGAAKSDSATEIQHGKNAIDAAKAAAVEHFVFVSVADANLFPDAVLHCKTKVVIEDYLKASGLKYSIIRPTAFFENFDDAANWNPLKKGRLKFMTTAECKYVATYDIGRAAAVMFQSPQQWIGETLDAIGWKGDLSQVAAALEKVGGVKVKYSLAMPILLRKWFLKDLHHMFLYFEVQKGPKGEPGEFKKVIPNALSAEDWFRFHGKYANGEKIGT